LMPEPGTGPRPGGWETLLYDVSMEHSIRGNLMLVQLVKESPCFCRTEGVFSSN
jgi:hypothetical protein